MRWDGGLVHELPLLLLLESLERLDTWVDGVLDGGRRAVRDVPLRVVLNGFRNRVRGHHSRGRMVHQGGCTGGSHHSTWNGMAVAHSAETVPVAIGDELPQLGGSGHVVHNSGLPGNAGEAERGRTWEDICDRHVGGVLVEEHSALEGALNGSVEAAGITQSTDSVHDRLAWGDGYTTGRMANDSVIGWAMHDSSRNLVHDGRSWGGNRRGLVCGNGSSSHWSDVNTRLLDECRSLAASNKTASGDAGLLNNTHGRLLEGSGFVGGHAWNLLDNCRTRSGEGPDASQGVTRLLEQSGSTRGVESCSSVRGDSTASYSGLLEDLDARLLHGSSPVCGGHTWLLHNGGSWCSEGGGPVSGHNSRALDDSGRGWASEGCGPVGCHTGNLLDNSGSWGSDCLDAGEGETGLLDKGRTRCGESSGPVGGDRLSRNGVHDSTAWSGDSLVSGNSGARCSQSNSRSVMNDRAIMAMQEAKITMKYGTGMVQGAVANATQAIAIAKVNGPSVVLDVRHTNSTDAVSEPVDVSRSMMHKRSPWLVKGGLAVSQAVAKAIA